MHRAADRSKLDLSERTRVFSVVAGALPELRLAVGAALESGDSTMMAQHLDSAILLLTTARRMLPAP